MGGNLSPTDIQDHKDRNTKNSQYGLHPLPAPPSPRAPSLRPAEKVSGPGRLYGRLSGMAHARQVSRRCSQTSPSASTKALTRHPVSNSRRAVLPATGVAPKSSWVMPGHALAGFPPMCLFPTTTVVVRAITAPQRLPSCERFPRHSRAPPGLPPDWQAIGFGFGTRIDLWYNHAGQRNHEHLCRERWEVTPPTTHYFTTFDGGVINFSRRERASKSAPGNVWAVLSRQTVLPIDDSCPVCWTRLGL